MGFISWNKLKKHWIWYHILWLAYKSNGDYFWQKLSYMPRIIHKYVRLYNQNKHCFPIVNTQSETYEVESRKQVMRRHHCFFNNWGRLMSYMTKSIDLSFKIFRYFSVTDIYAHIFCNEFYAFKDRALANRAFSRLEIVTVFLSCVSRA